MFLSLKHKSSLFEQHFRTVRTVSLKPKKCSTRSDFAGCITQIRHVISQSAIKMLISDIISRLSIRSDRGGSYCKATAMNAQEVTGEYRISLILFDVREGDDCCTSCVSIIIKQKDFVTFPMSGSARRMPL